MTGAAVQISQLSKRYTDFVAVDDVSLDVAPGEFVTLLGLSGSGKTTTLMAVAGFVELDAGRIAIDGRDIVDLPPEKRDLGVVFQNYALFPHLNVFENIAFPLRMRKWSEAAIAKAVGRVLEIVSLGSFASRKIAALSGGQQQRVALARALVFEPPVLLMDEPLGALDRSLRDQLQTEIKRIQRDLGVTVIYVTHDQEEALALSDRIAVMAEGKICQLATPDEIYERPASAFVAGFVGESNFIEVELRGQDGQVVRVSPKGMPDALYAATAAAPTTQGAALMAIRPEALQLDAAEVAGPGNALAGRVALREFMGATVRLTIDTALGPLTVRDGRVSEAARFRAGDTVRLSWNERDALLFPPR
ncbi:ABC transporter ATP-binding protein [Bosea sp. 124]|uniref:ABC transporter ATP-binding protein n=1 Tax=Bosea sp. 124 TaxID=2135642 RepID=UPI000D3AE49C|nr:ABC transporter ATP-binding protein [Bosea sp. 124]PTM40035.1 putative spermidine/putrescine transport system ATP-binding protein [Bosea sp. 124]